MLITSNIGSIIIEEQKHLQEYTGPALSYYSNTIRLGQMARMMGKMRRLEVISNPDILAVFGADVGISDDNYVNTIILPAIERTGAISIYRDGSGRISKVEENISSEADILKITGELWESIEPKEPEEISLYLIDACSQLPKIHSEIDSELSSSGFKQPEQALQLSVDLSLIQGHTISGVSETVYHTPYYAKERTRDMFYALKGMKQETRVNVGNLLDHLESNPAIPLSTITDIAPDDLLHYQKVGLIDITEVSSRCGKTERFIFSPAIWSPFGSTMLKDEQEHVRALLSCVRYGQVSPTKIDGVPYPIKYPEKYIAALIRRGKVGPSSPIGTDYVILEKEGIVKIEQSAKPGQYEMTLVKEDIAESARRILSMGRDVTVEQGDIDARNLSQQGSFDNSAQTRARTIATLSKKPKCASDFVGDKIIEVLRGGNL